MEIQAFIELLAAFTLVAITLMRLGTLIQTHHDTFYSCWVPDMERTNRARAEGAVHIVIVGLAVGIILHVGSFGVGASLAVAVVGVGFATTYYAVYGARHRAAVRTQEHAKSLAAFTRSSQQH